MLKEQGVNRTLNFIFRVLTIGSTSHTLQAKRFNHAFEYLRWIICWDFDTKLTLGAELQGIEETETRGLQTATGDGHSIYFLDSYRRAKKIQIIRLKEYLKQRLNLEFEILR